MDFLKLQYKSGFITADLVFIETANTLWKHTYILKRIPHTRYNLLKQNIIPLIKNSVIEIYLPSNYLEDILENALKMGITVYDSIYLTLALKHKCKLASFDEKLKEKLKEKNLDIMYIP